VLRRLSILLVGFVSICALAIAAVALWVLVGFLPESRKSDADALTSQFEARKGESVRGGDPLKVTGTAQPDPRRETGAQGRPEAEVKSPSIVFLGTSPPTKSDHNGGASAERSGSSSADAAEPKKATKETQAEMGAGADTSLS